MPLIPTTVARSMCGGCADHAMYGGITTNLRQNKLIVRTKHKLILSVWVYFLPSDFDLKLDQVTSLQNYEIIMHDLTGHIKSFGHNLLLSISTCPVKSHMTLLVHTNLYPKNPTGFFVTHGLDSERKVERVTSQDSYRYEPCRRELPSTETIACASRIVNGIDRALKEPVDDEMLLAIVLNLRASLLLLTGSSEVEIYPQPQPWYSL